jgi:hypothetical protein
MNWQLTIPVVDPSPECHIIFSTTASDGKSTIARCCFHCLPATAVTIGFPYMSHRRTTSIPIRMHDEDDSEEDDDFVIKTEPSSAESSDEDQLSY